MEMVPTKGIKNSKIFDNKITSELSNVDVQIDIVHEFFDGKYTVDEVKDYLTIKDMIEDPNFEEDRPIDRPTLKLAQEFRDLKNKDYLSVQEWYRETPYYLFDLLKWNVTEMFAMKFEHIDNLIKKYNISSIIDFGGGIGIPSMMLIEASGIQMDKLVYVDLKGSPTFNFAKFLFDRFEFDIKMMDPEELYKSDIRTDACLALDVFEHIVNIEYHLSRISTKSKYFINFNEFSTDIVQPQHIHTFGHFGFAQFMLQYHYLPVEWPTIFQIKSPQWKITEENKIVGPVWDDVSWEVNI